MTWLANASAEVWGRTAIGLAILVAASYIVLRVLGISERRRAAWSIVRAAIQLAVLGIILSTVLHDVRWVFVALAIMLGVAIRTSGRRIGVRGRQQWLTVAVAIPAGVLWTVAVVFASRTLAPTPSNLLAIGGIICGNAMTVTSLTGRGLLDRLADEWDIVEGWLALGASPRKATLGQARAAVAHALLPGMDQAATTGLVTLPGAFVGAVFGGADALEAARFQLVVLAGILSASAVCAGVVVAGMGAVARKPSAPDVEPH